MKLIEELSAACPEYRFGRQSPFSGADRRGESGK